MARTRKLLLIFSTPVNCFPVRDHTLGGRGTTARIQYSQAIFNSQELLHTDILLDAKPQYHSPALSSEVHVSMKSYFKPKTGVVSGVPKAQLFHSIIPDIIPKLRVNVYALWCAA